MVRLSALALLLATQVHAAELQALILTGATTEAAAAPLLEGAKKRTAVLSNLLQLSAGFPRVAHSDTIPGLKPGFCPSDEPALKAIDAGAYARPLRDAPRLRDAPGRAR